MINDEIPLLDLLSCTFSNDHTLIQAADQSLCVSQYHLLIFHCRQAQKSDFHFPSTAIYPHLHQRLFVGNQHLYILLSAFLLFLHEHKLRFTFYLVLLSPCCTSWLAPPKSLPSITAYHTSIVRGGVYYSHWLVFPQPFNCLLPPMTIRSLQL